MKEASTGTSGGLRGSRTHHLRGGQGFGLGHLDGLTGERAMEAILIDDGWERKREHFLGGCGV